MQQVVNQMVPRFLEQLKLDYARWASGRQHGASRCAYCNVFQHVYIYAIMSLRCMGSASILAIMETVMKTTIEAEHIPAHWD